MGLTTTATTTATTTEKPNTTVGNNKASNKKAGNKKADKREVDQLLKHPGLWRAHQLGTYTRQSNQGLPTGFSELDTYLPDRGWPHNGLIELILAHAGIGELRLLMPALQTLSQQESRWIAWVNPPFVPYAPALQHLGIDTQKILLVRPQTHKDTLWALERICKSGNCSSALAWLDERKLKLKDTQRLQVAAKQGRTLTGLFRPQRAMQQSSMAELRLRLLPGKAPDLVQLEILKRRGGWALQGQHSLMLDVAAATASTRHTPHDMREHMRLWRLQQQAQTTLPEQTLVQSPISADVSATLSATASATTPGAVSPIAPTEPRSPTGLH